MSFRFKQFSIGQEHAAMKVGTDGVLIGAWCSMPHGEVRRVLDVGTGTGLLALMVAQRFPSVVIDAIDVDEGAVSDATDNVIASPFSDRVRVMQADFCCFDSDGEYDAIVCNPPYFVNSLLCPDKARSVARHTSSLSFTDLVCHSARVLKSGGYLNVILPSQEKSHFIDILASFGFAPVRITDVCPTPGAAPKRVMICAEKLAEEAGVAVVSDNLTIELSRHSYSEEYVALTRQFYLKM